MIPRLRIRVSNSRVFDKIYLYDDSRLLNRTPNMNRPNFPKSNLDPLNHNPNVSFNVILGGGGARGLAHLGVMQAIFERRIRVRRTVGVSMGALIAGLCAIEVDPGRARERAFEFLRSRRGRKLQAIVLSAGGLSTNKSGRRLGTRLFHVLKKQKALSRAVRSHSLLPSTILRELIDALIPDQDIQDLPNPIQIVTVDLRSGERIVLESGSLRRAIRASMSIPGIFPPVHHEGKLLSDIGVFHSVPCDIPAGDGSEHEKIIAVDVGKQADDCAPCVSALDAMLRSQALAEQTIRKQSLALADVVIRPDLSKVHWFDFSNLEEVVEAGYVAAGDALKEHRTSNAELPTSK